jgi:glycosyltransferase involved in cell wall biosynthesis
MTAAAGDPGGAAAAPLVVAAFSGGVDVPGARFRMRPYVTPLRAYGIELVEYPSRAGQYPPVERSRRPAWAARNLASRLADVRRAHARGAAVSYLQREFLATTVTLERLTPRPRVLDVDDSIWLYGGERFARRLAGLCDVVACGNAFLAEWFARSHRRVELLPTAVDTAHFVPSAAPPDDDAPVIGWSGSASTLHYLHAIERPLAAVLRRHPRARLRVLCDRAPSLASLGERVEFVRWSQDGELRALQGMTVGLMPLDDTVASRGKCSLKMLLYMACGVPAVVSPVGANRDVLACGDDVALTAATDDDWVGALDLLLRDPRRARALGARGRAAVEASYSVRAIAPRLAAILRGAAS